MSDRLRRGPERWSDLQVRGRRAVALAALLLVAACSGEAPVPEAAPAPAPPAPSTLWLCSPELADDPCQGGLDATVVGDGRVEEFRPAEEPPVDCFYVYPTVSRVTALNAPLAVDASLVAVARAQAARFSEVCRVFAPVYRQLTLSAIFTGRYDDLAGRAMAERDVELAWRDYLTHHNDGRGVVLIGHSQGARTLTALLAKRIEPDDEVRERLVSALLLGGDVTVAEGQDVGGSFATTPACRAAAQTGCVVAYSAYDDVPPPDAVFGRTAAPGQQVLCTDPSRLAGGDGALHPYLPTSALVPAGGLSSVVPGVATGFAAYPGQVRGECRVANGVSYLHVERQPAAQLPAAEAALGPRWGLHNGDVNLALGDLVALVRQQAEAHAR